MNVFANNRDHRKITVVDGRVGYRRLQSGGGVISTAPPRYGRWKDSSIRLEGDARGLTLVTLELLGRNAEAAAPEVGRYLPDVPYTARENAVVLPCGQSAGRRGHPGENVCLKYDPRCEGLRPTTPTRCYDEMQRTHCGWHPAASM